MEVGGCTNPDAENYDDNADIDDGSCIIVGCIWDWWFICTSSINLDATVGDYTYCVFDFSGNNCGDDIQAMAINNTNTNVEIQKNYGDRLVASKKS